MEKLHCMIHYTIKEAKCSKIKAISEINKDNIYAAKDYREELGSQNYHKQQCRSIPDEIDPESHGIHLEPCYKKFTLILFIKKSSSAPGGSSDERSVDNGSRPKRARVSSDKESRPVFPKECNFCGEYRIKRKK